MSSDSLSKIMKFIGPNKENWGPLKINMDHKALLLYLSGETNSETTQTRLVRWVGRLLPFDYKIEYIPG